MEKEIFQQLGKEFQLPDTLPVYSEEALIEALANEIYRLLMQNTEALFSVLYRLDVPESSVMPLLDPQAPALANVEIAKLIVKREKEKALSRARYKNLFKSKDELEDEDISPW